MRTPSILTSLCLIGALALACGNTEPSLTPPVVAIDAVPTMPEGDDPATVAYYGHGYNRCDARLLSQHWQIDLGVAPVKAARMITAGRPDGVEAALSAAREKVGQGQIEGCTFHETDFAYEDAELLAKAWGTGVDEAKTTLASKATWGSMADARQMIEAARVAPAAPEQSPDDQALSAFLRSEEVDACHARMLANAWGSTLSQAKAILGHKLLNDRRDLLEQSMGEARTHARERVEARCDWGDLPYTWEDAQALAKLWGTDTGQAKARVLDKYLDGTDREVVGVLRRAKRR